MPLRQRSCHRENHRVGKPKLSQNWSAFEHQRKFVAKLSPPLACRSESDTEPEVTNANARDIRGAGGRSAFSCRAVTVTATAPNPIGTRFWTPSIERFATWQIFKIPVGTPFPYITEHIVKAPCIWIFRAHRALRRGAAGILFSRPSGGVPAFPLIANAAVASVPGDVVQCRSIICSEYLQIADISGCR